MLAIPSDSNELDYETKHVHEVYEEIATHFSATRYKVCFFFSFRFPSAFRLHEPSIEIPTRRSLRRHRWPLLGFCVEGVQF